MLHLKLLIKNIIYKEKIKEYYEQNKEKIKEYREQNNKKSRYFCDIYIPKTNTIYEVKSTWTYNLNIEVNLLKKQTCIDAGYNFELWIFDAKGNRINEVIL